MLEVRVERDQVVGLRLAEEGAAEISGSPTIVNQGGLLGDPRAGQRRADRVCLVNQKIVTRD